MMVMTVNPGFSGQKYLSFVDEKIEKLIHLKDKYNYKILIDGAVSEDVMKNLSTRGVDGFVLGTSSLFGKQKSYKELFNSFKKIER
jgi:ribulose-phosphate 3-epimerase